MRIPGGPGADLRAYLSLLLSLCASVIVILGPSAGAVAGGPGTLAPSGMVAGGSGTLAPSGTVAGGSGPRPDSAAALSAALGLRGVEPSAEVTRRPATRWGWPLPGVPPIVRPYDPPAQRWLPGHRGIDLRGVEGEPVLAVEAGVVSYSGTIAGVGIVSVTHADGLRSTYQPVEDRVPQGTRVGRGSAIGVLGVGHCPPGACLHLGARRGEHYVDPTPLLQPLELTLVPLG